MQEGSESVFLRISKERGSPLVLLMFNRAESKAHKVFRRGGLPPNSMKKIAKKYIQNPKSILRLIKSYKILGTQFVV